MPRDVPVKDSTAGMVECSPAPCRRLPHNFPTDVPRLFRAMIWVCVGEFRYLRRERRDFFVDTDTPLAGIASGSETPAKEIRRETEGRG